MLSAVLLQLADLRRGALPLDRDVLLVVVVAALLVALVALIGSILALTRRRVVREAREIVRALEDLRSRRAVRPPAVDATSPLSAVADAFNRVSHDLTAERRALAGAGDRGRALDELAQQAALVTADADGDIRGFSAGASALLGWDEDEVVSQPLALLFEERAWSELLPKLMRRSAVQRGFVVRTTLARRDGARFPAEVSLRALRDPKGEPHGVVLLVTDVTAQVDLEHRLRHAEEHYRGLVEGLAEGVLVVQDGRLAYVNSAAAELLGRPAAELIGTALHERVATRDVMVLADRLAAIERRGGAAQLDCTLLPAAGATPLDVHIRVSRTEHDGSAAALLLLADRATERRMTAQLRRNEARLDAVLEAATEGVLLLSGAGEGGVVEVVNVAFAARFGLATTQLIGANEPRLLQLLAERGPAGAAVAQRIAAQRTSGAETIHVAGPPARDLEVVVRPLADRQGEDLGRMILLREVTEQRAVERKLQGQAESLQLAKVELEQAHRRLSETHVELRSKSEDLERLNQELRRLDQMKSNLLGNVSHELQTPLVSIRGYTEMTLKERLGPITDEQRHGLTLSLKNIDRLIAMIDNLLAFSRADPQLGRLQLRRFALEPLVGEAAELLEEQRAAKELRLTVDLRPGAIELLADRDKILQVFVNLLSNAIKYNRQGGWVSVAADPGQPGYATVTVADSGVGVPPEALGRIFDRHYQVERVASQQAKGSGIGLSLVRDILRLHGCSIHAESEEGRGSRFVFTLPLSTDRDERPTGTPTSSPGSSDPEPTGGRRLRIIRRNPAD